VILIKNSKLDEGMLDRYLKSVRYIQVLTFKLEICYLIGIPLDNNNFKIEIC